MYLEKCFFNSPCAESGTADIDDCSATLSKPEFSSFCLILIFWQAKKLQKIQLNMIILLIKTKVRSLVNRLRNLDMCFSQKEVCNRNLFLA